MNMMEKLFFVPITDIINILETQGNIIDNRIFIKAAKELRKVRDKNRDIVCRVDTNLESRTELLPVEPLHIDHIPFLYSRKTKHKTVPIDPEEK